MPPTTGFSQSPNQKSQMKTSAFASRNPPFSRAKQTLVNAGRYPQKVAAPRPTTPSPGQPGGYVDPLEGNHVPGQGAPLPAGPIASQPPAQPAAPAGLTPPPASTPYQPPSNAASFGQGWGSGQSAPNPPIGQGPGASRSREQQEWAGNALDLFGIGSGSSDLKRRDIPLLALDFWAQNFNRSLADRGQAEDIYRTGWGNVGQTEEALLAKQLASEWAQTGPFDDAYLEQQRGAIGDAGAMGTRNALDRMAAEQARRGVGGSSFASRDQALLEQQAALDMQQQFADLDKTTRLANSEAQRAAAQMLAGISSSEDQLRAGYDTALGHLFSDTEYGEPDWEALMQGVKGGNKNVVGNPNRRTGRNQSTRRAQRGK